MKETYSLRKNPSRETCEDIIRRILNRELSENGGNLHFKHPADFMKYFESLYPASESLTKQVQRAIKTMDLPKNSDGYYIITKTKKQFEQDRILKEMFQTANVQTQAASKWQKVFLSAEPSFQVYLIHLLMESITLKDYILTIQQTADGLFLYTKDENQLLELLQEYLFS